MNPKGNVWWIGGKRDTGKSYESLMIADYFHQRKANPKRVIVIDHTNNEDTYGHIKKIKLSALDFKLPEDGYFRICREENEPNFDFKTCYQKLAKLANTVIDFDDVTGVLRGTAPAELMTLCGLAKNQRLEIIFQFHTVTATAPQIIGVCNMIVVKQTNEDLPLKESFVNSRMVGVLMQEIRAENRTYDDRKKWGTRILDVDSEQIYVKNIKGKSYVESYRTKPKSLESYFK